MTEFEILHLLNTQKIKIFVEDSTLQVNAPKGAMTAEIMALLKNNKQRLISYLLATKENSVTISKAPNNHAMALSFAQQRMWFIDQMDDGSAHYNMPTAMRLKGGFKVLVAEAAFKQIIQRHETLRTIFLKADKEPVQTIQNEFSFSIKQTDLSHLGQNAYNKAVETAMREDAQKSFNLSKDLMLRVAYLKFSDQEGVMLFNMHHIASDGWSVGVLINEFVTLYKAAVLGLPNPLVPLEIQYADYAYWQRHWLQGAVLERQLGYWDHQLAELPQLHSLPLDFVRPQFQTFKGAVHHFEINAQTLTGLKHTAVDNQATLFMVVHAVFSILLSRYANSSDVVIGTPVANRLQKELEPLIGFFANTLVLRADMSSNLSFVDFLNQIKHINLDAQANQDVPFEYLVDRLNPTRNVSYNPLFQIMLSMNTNESIDFSLPDVTLSAAGNEQPVTAKFDLLLSAIPTDGVLNCSFEYNTDLFKAETVVRLADSMQHLCQGIVDDGTKNIFKLPLLNAVENQFLLNTLNDTSADYPSDDCMHQLFERQVTQTPDAIAVEFEEQSLNYADLNLKANQLAHYLVQQGVQVDEVVGLCMRRSLTMIIGILAVMKAGAAYLPLDPDYPKGRLKHMMDDSGLTCVLTQLDSEKITQGQCAVQLTVDDPLVSELLSKQPTDNPLIQGLRSTHLAYVIYTSGSTGLPKGVMVEHQALVNRIDWMQKTYQLTENDVVLQKTPFSFDVSVWEFTWFFTVGAKLVIATPDGHKDPHYLSQIIQQRQVTTLHFVPSMFRLMLANPDWALCRSLRLVFCSGEALSVDIPAIHYARNKAILHNLYGPTEAAIDVTYWQTPDTSELKTVPIGRPIQNIQLLILNQQFQLQPKGSIGELFIAGVGLARGYLNQAALTAERFIDNEFSVIKSKKLYRTGDMVRYLSDGNIEYIGRVDDQIKLHGLRIELGEIEAQLSTHQDVDASVAVIKKASADQQLLVAYFTSKSSQDDSLLVTSIKQHLNKMLPTNMVPSRFIRIATIPLSANGKIDYKSLPDLDLLDVGDEFVIPTGERQQKLALLWSELLKRPVESISAHANFFELGGHSLLTIRLLAETRAAFDCELSVRDVFTNPQLSIMAEKIDQSTTSKRPKITPVPRSFNQANTSYAQQRLWFIDQMDGGSANYNMPSAMLLTGDFNVMLAEQVLEEIIRRHETLRTVYKNGSEGPLQVINENFEFSIKTVDLTHLSEVEQQQVIKSAVQHDAESPFDLSQDLMLRVGYLRLSDERGVLLFNMHHIASDGWSMGVLIDEFEKGYSAHLNGTANPLPPLDIQYADYAHWQNNWLQGEVFERQLNYWDSQLADLPQVHNLPLDFDRPQFQTFNGASHQFELGADTLTGLNSTAHNSQVTLFMCLHAAFSVLLSRYSNDTDVVIGTPVANRLQKELEPLIGFFVNTLVLRADCSDNPSFIDFLEKIKDINIAAQANQEVPFEHLVDRLNPTRSTSHNALFQVMLSMNTNENVEMSLPGITVSSVTTDELKVTAKFDLLLMVAVVEGRLMCTFQYNTDLFKPRTIERMADSLISVLEAVAKDPTAKLSHLPILNQTEKHYLLKTLNDNHVDYPSDTCVHQAFEQQVVQHPEYSAVTFENTSISYLRLNNEANKLAHFLTEQGVMPDEFVGVCLERSMDMIIAVMAILKAGAAYLPLDSTFPQQRLNHMMDDSQLSWVISQQKLQPLTRGGNRQQCIMDGPIWQQNKADYSTENLSIAGLTANNLAYAIYTSGSTGKPKGVIIEHHQINNMLQYFSQQAPCNGNFNTSLWTNLNFDVSVFEIFSALIFGGHLMVVDEKLRLLPNDYFDWMSDNNISSTYLPPFYINQFCHWLDTNKTLNLERLLVGVEPIKETLLHRIQSAMPTVTLMNAYGPTETTVCCTAYTLKNDDANEQSGYVPIGRAMMNCGVYILDQNLTLLPQGTIGELYIGGVGVARGYLNQPELTAEKFIQNPFSDNATERLYKSGDLVRYREDGNLEFIGRVDHQVKIRGFRIELSEIENQLIAHPEIIRCLVIVGQREEQEKQLIAYFTSASPLIETELIKNIRTSLSHHLADYMVPALFIKLDEFPLTANGKIDRQALPEPQAITQNKIHVAPKNTSEQQLVEIWSELLKLPVDSISTDANFFELGGHSLIMTNMLHLMTERMNVQLAVKDVFNCPTIEAIVTHMAAESPSPIHILKQQDNSVPLPLSYGQYRIWFIEQMRTQTNEHNMAVAVKLKGDLKANVLEEALNLLVQKHDILRTKIIVENNIPMQRVEPEYCCHLDSADLSALSVTEKQIETKRLTNEHDTRIFKLSELPLLSVQLLKIDQNEFLLHFNQHHIISDGWSQQLFYFELLNSYQDIIAGKAKSVDVESLNYADYAVWQQAWMATEEADVQRLFWKTYLLDSQEQMILPIQKSNGKFDGNQNIVKSHIKASLRNSLKDMGHSQKGSLFNVLHAGFVLLLTRLSGETDFNMGLPVTGRHVYGTQRMLGMFLNILPVRHRVNLQASFADLLKQQINNVEQVLSNQDLPLEEIIKVAASARSAESTPLFQILFNMLSVPESSTAENNLDFEILPEETAEISSKFNITLYIKDSEEGINIVCHFNNSAFSHQHMQNFIDQYTSLLSQVALNNNAKCGSYDLNKTGLSIEYTETDKWTNNAVSDVTALFRSHAKSSPDSIALSDEYSDWSYQNLLKYSFGLGSELIEMGIKRGDIVTIMASRQANLVAGILAVLQLGAAYSIVTDDTPVNRIIQHMKTVNNKLILLCEPEETYGPDLIEQISVLSPIKSMVNTPNYYPHLANEFKPEIDLLDLTACVTFTSGSSGVPKAVAGSHLGLSGYLDWLPAYVGFSKGDHFGMLSGLAHDPLQRDIFGALCTGATLYIPDKQDFLSLHFSDWIKDQSISTLHLTPAMAEIICLEKNVDLKQLKTVFLTGEQLRRDVVKLLLDLNPSIQIYNCYGATETQRALTYFKVEDLNVLDSVVPIAMEAPDTRIKLINANKTYCGVGEMGTICIESHRIAKGYINDDELTKQLFITAENGCRRYITGDLGVCLDGKNIKYLGRQDKQVNIRGFRIELGEIEYRLSQCDLVKSCTTVLHENEFIIAYVVLVTSEEKAEELIAQCKLYLQSHLPQYMLPSTIIVLDKIPLNENKKVDRKALPSADKFIDLKQYQAPEKPIEITLSRLWSDLLKMPIEKISLTSNFFELGGHSLLLLKLLSEIRVEFELEINLKFLFECQNLSVLADLIDSMLKQINVTESLAQAAADEIDEVEI